MVVLPLIGYTQSFVAVGCCFEVKAIYPKSKVMTPNIYLLFLFSLSGKNRYPRFADEHKNGHLTPGFHIGDGNSEVVYRLKNCSKNKRCCGATFRQ